jgi:hypothetical protein
MQGPNVKKLIATRIAQLAIPAGRGTLSAGLAFLQDKIRIIQTAKQATADVEMWIAVVRSAPDNEFTTDEEIAGEILQRLEEQKKAKA